MMKHLKLSGCPITPQNLHCAPCDWTRAGGFSPEKGSILLCEGKFMGKTHMEDTIVHELVHMYDHCKFKVDWQNLRHHACSEVSGLLLSFDASPNSV
jgi:inner membrane protease ATP23